MHHKGSGLEGVGPFLVSPRCLNMELGCGPGDFKAPRRFSVPVLKGLLELHRLSHSWPSTQGFADQTAAGREHLLCS